MTGNDGYWIERQLTLATCAAQVADAVAVALEQGDEYSLATGAAMDKIDGIFTPHLEAAVIMMALWLGSQGGNTQRWRESIPNLVSIIAVSESA